MTVIGTSEELNAVLKAVNPDFPHQNFENAGPEFTYTFGGINVTVKLMTEEEDT